MKTKRKRFTKIRTRILAIILTFTTLSAVGSTALNVYAEEIRDLIRSVGSEAFSENAFEYALFNGSEDSVFSMNASSVKVQGDIHSNGGFVYRGNEFEADGIIEAGNHLLGTDGDDMINGYAEAVGYHQNETVHGLGGDDQINVGDGDDTVYGDAGDDTIFAGSGQDVLIGGAGNDYLDGGTGNDIYRFERDTIFDFEDSFSEGRADKIIFGNNISIDDISLRREGNDLIVDYGEDDRITIASAYQIYWGEGKYRVENVDFADGMQTMIDYDNQEMIVTYQPEGMDDVIEESDGLSEVIETAAFADIVEEEAEHLAELMIQEMSGVVEENISDKMTTEKNTGIVDELLWVE